MTWTLTAALTSSKDFISLETAGAQTAPLTVKRIDTVVNRHGESYTKMQARMRGVEAVACGIIIPRTDDLLATDHAIVTGIPEFKTEFLPEAGNNNFIILEQRQTTNELGRLDGTIPESWRSVLIDAQRDGRIVQLKSTNSFEDHEGDGIGGIFAGIAINAANRGMLVSVPDAGRLTEFSRRPFVETVGFQEKGVDDLLRLIRVMRPASRSALRNGQVY